MKITVATLAFGEVPYLRYTEAINRRYCTMHGYRFEVIRPQEQVLRSPIWYKVSGVRDLLPASDYVLFLDADAYVIDLRCPIEALVTEHMGEAAMLLGADRRDKDFAWSDTNGNAGTFLVRNCEKAFEILDEWWNSPLEHNRKWLWAWPPEQGSLNAHIRTGPNAAWIKVIYYAHMNGVDGTFIRHLIGFSDEERLAHLRAHARACTEWGAIFRQLGRLLVSRLTRATAGSLWREEGKKTEAG